MRKRNRKSQRNRQQGNQTSGRKAFKVERLEDRRMMAGDLDSSINQECFNDDECFYFAARWNGGETDDRTQAIYEWAVENELVGPLMGAVSFEARQMIEQKFEEGTAVDNASHRAGKAIDKAADEMPEGSGAGDGDDGNSVGWHTGFLGIPYYNLEDTTPGGEDDGEQEDGGVGDEDDKLTWASWLGGTSDGQEESSDGGGQEEGSSGDDEGSEEEDTSGDEDDDDGITWFWEDDDDEDEDDEDDDEGDGQSRQTEDSRDSDPRRSGSGPDPRQGGLGRPGGDSKTDPTPYRGAIVQGGNSDPSDPDSGRSVPGVGPEHPTAGAIDYGPDGKPASYQGYLPPKELLVQGGDSDPPKNSEHLAVDSVFSDLGAEHAGAVVEAPVAKEPPEKSVDLENQTGLQANQEMVRMVRSMYSSQFENSNQKATQYVNMLSSVLRKMNEMGNGVIKNLT